MVPCSVSMWQLGASTAGKQCPECVLTLTQIPQPIQSSSEIQAILDAEVASTHSLPAECHTDGSEGL